MATGNTHKDQHTVQKAYLKEFVLDSTKDHKFEVFSKRERKWESKHQSPSSTTTEEYYYSTIDSKGNIDSSREHWLDREIENPGIKLLRQLSAGGATLNKREKKIVANYVGCSLTRTTKTREVQSLINDTFDDPDMTQKFVEMRRHKYERIVPETEIDDFISQVQSRGYGVQLENDWYLKRLKRGLFYGEIIASMNWVVETTKSPEWFITSDHPAFVCRPKHPRLPYPIGLIRDDLQAEVCMPLSATAFLRASFCKIGDKDQERRAASRPRVRELNRRVAIQATDLIIAPERTPRIESVVSEEAGSSTRLLDVAALFQKQR